MSANGMAVITATAGKARERVRVHAQLGTFPLLSEATIVRMTKTREGGYRWALRFERLDERMQANLQAFVQHQLAIAARVRQAQLYAARMKSTPVPIAPQPPAPSPTPAPVEVETDLANTAVEQALASEVEALVPEESAPQRVLAIELPSVVPSGAPIEPRKKPVEQGYGSFQPYTPEVDTDEASLLADGPLTQPASPPSPAPAPATSPDPVSAATPARPARPDPTLLLPETPPSSTTVPAPSAEPTKRSPDATVMLPDQGPPPGVYEIDENQNMSLEDILSEVENGEASPSLPSATPTPVAISAPPLQGPPQPELSPGGTIIPGTELALGSDVELAPEDATFELGALSEQPMDSSTAAVMPPSLDSDETVVVRRDTPAGVADLVQPPVAAQPEPAAPPALGAPFPGSPTDAPSFELFEPVDVPAGDDAEVPSFESLALLGADEDVASSFEPLSSLGAETSERVDEEAMSSFEPLSSLGAETSERVDEEAMSSFEPLSSLGAEISERVDEEAVSSFEPLSSLGAEISERVDEEAVSSFEPLESQLQSFGGDEAVVSNFAPLTPLGTRGAVEPQVELPVEAPSEPQVQLPVEPNTQPLSSEPVAESAGEALQGQGGDTEPSGVAVDGQMPSFEPFDPFEPLPAGTHEARPTSGQSFEPNPIEMPAFEEALEEPQRFDPLDPIEMPSSDVEAVDISGPASGVDVPSSPLDGVQIDDLDLDAVDDNVRAPTLVEEPSPSIYPDDGAPFEPFDNSPASSRPTPPPHDLGSVARTLSELPPPVEGLYTPIENPSLDEHSGAYDRASFEPFPSPTERDLYAESTVAFEEQRDDPRLRLASLQRNVKAAEELPEEHSMYLGDIEGVTTNLTPTHAKLTMTDESLPSVAFEGGGVRDFDEFEGSDAHRGTGVPDAAASAPTRPFLTDAVDRTDGPHDPLAIGSERKTAAQSTDPGYHVVPDFAGGIGGDEPSHSDPSRPQRGGTVVVADSRMLDLLRAPDDGPEVTSSDGASGFSAPPAFGRRSAAAMSGFTMVAGFEDDGPAAGGTMVATADDVAAWKEAGMGALQMGPSEGFDDAHTSAFTPAPEDLESLAPGRLDAPHRGRHGFEEPRDGEDATFTSMRVEAGGSDGGAGFQLNPRGPAPASAPTPASIPLPPTDMPAQGIVDFDEPDPGPSPRRITDMDRSGGPAPAPAPTLPEPRPEPVRKVPQLRGSGPIDDLPTGPHRTVPPRSAPPAASARPTTVPSPVVPSPVVPSPAVPSPAVPSPAAHVPAPPKRALVEDALAELKRKTEEKRRQRGDAPEPQPKPKSATETKPMKGKRRRTMSRAQAADPRLRELFKAALSDIEGKRE